MFAERGRIKQTISNVQSVVRGLVEDSVVSVRIGVFSKGTALKIALQKINLIL